jgi:hypothetical protein
MSIRSSPSIGTNANLAFFERHSGSEIGRAEKSDSRQRTGVPGGLERRRNLKPTALTDEFAVPHRPNLVTTPGNVGIMGDQHDGLAVFLGQSGQEVKDQR